ncbi:hypothetical protein ABZ814_20575 [Micromonospora musae]|uniref:Uncharacterized protein n=1 Tax=Micromonospora musae TaxID=1894970 RepID=A0A3A9Y4Q0_9ACTN|nr:hypothetical protein [Micromonospora musae]RKN32435.1 hypothetical protein D7044_14465 [Micromonospora musae]
MANTFIATGNLHPALRAVAQWNPVSAVVQAVRVHFGSISPALASPRAWPLRDPVAASLGWAVLILAVCVPLAVWRYRKVVSR